MSRGSLFCSIKRVPSWLPPVVLYVALAFAVYYSSSGRLDQITTDFKRYQSYACTFFPWESLSGLSQALCNSYREQGYSHEWTPSPVYVAFLWPLLFLGSNLLLALQGLAVGVVSIFSLDRILSNPKVFHWLSSLQRLVILMIVVLYRPFLLDTLTVSSMGLASCFVLLGLSLRPGLWRSFVFVLASLLRPNVVLIFGPLLFSIAIFRPSGAKVFLRDLVPSLGAYALMYAAFYSTYSGSKLNYLFMADAQGLDFAAFHLKQALSSLGISHESLNDVMDWNLGFKQFAGLVLKDFKIFSHIFHLSVMKFLTNLGFIFENTFISEWGNWYSKVWATLYSFLIIIPGFYSTALTIFSRQVSSSIRVASLTAILYVLGSSLMFGDPRYVIGFHALFVVNGLFLVRAINSFVPVEDGLG